MKRSVRVATCAVAAVAAIGLSSGPASADPAPPNDNGYTYALPDNDIPCFGVSPHILALPLQASFATYDKGDGNVVVTLSPPTPYAGEYYSHIDFRWRNDDTGKSGGERYMSHRVFMKGHDEFPIAIGKGRIELSADISNSSTPDSFRFPMTPCRSFVTVP